MGVVTLFFIIKIDVGSYNMDWFQIGLLCFLILAASYLSSVQLINFICLKLGIKFAFLIFPFLMIIVHITLALFITLKFSLIYATAILSMTALAWGLLAYFQQQRFVKSYERSSYIRKYPMNLPVINSLLFISCSLEFGLALGWFWSITPFILWLFFGYISAEIAIRSLMRGNMTTTTRKEAIFYLNDSQGRVSISRPSSLSKYPFP